MEYMMAALFEAGPSMAGSMGDVPLDWQNAVAFARGYQSIEEPWEIKALVDMSAAYVSARAAGTDVLAISPVEQEGL
jgi:hypothetical protein